MSSQSFSIFDLILESENWFSKLFSPDWKGKMVLFVFGLVHKIGKWFLNFILNMQNFHLMHLLKESLVEIKYSNQLFLLFFVDLVLKMEMEIFSFENRNKINILTKCFFFSFIDSALKIEMKYLALEIEMKM
ncbi:hypothetical protein C1645_731053 [Glomus cerebriforme]|uniref:Uncharacterized protein n=1 Tax=Glomus cerebriforme TaxID=658196 RepID=A0A397TM30_9GLOM|nr:hypothetical protein C1645_731053 [Glomus cerebriforme]